MVKNLITNQVNTQTFDIIMICNGHHFDPVIPVIKNMKIFED